MRPHQTTSRRPPPDNRRPSFGERVAIVDRLLGGQESRQDVCRRYAISAEELDRWVRLHARDRPVSLNEFRLSPAPAPAIRRLVGHLRQLESVLRTRQRELLLLKQIARGRGLL